MKTIIQLRYLLAFEMLFFFKRIAMYLVLAAFLGMGLFGGSSLSAFSTENIYRNSPFAITYILGYLSLFCIFLTTILGAQVLFRESEYHFSLVLYATPLKKINFFLSRFLVIFGLSALALFLLVTGFMIGQRISGFDPSEFGPFYLWYYLQPFFLLIVPNTFLCSSLICSVGLLSRNKLAVYVSGLFIFIGYQVTLIFSGSPLIAGGLPPTEESMQIAALLDPFGLSAFLQQTLEWSAVQRNTRPVSLIGTMLFNRVFYAVLSIIVIFVSYRFFRLSVEEMSKKVKEKLQSSRNIAIYKVSFPQPFSIPYQLLSLFSLLKIDLKFVLKSIPFLLILIGMIFFISMEMYGEIEQGVRIPLRYACTGLMVNTILEMFPALCSLVILFYSNELLWRSRISNFHLIENTTPISLSIHLFAKWMAMACIIFLLLLGVVFTGILFQLVYKYPYIEWNTYIQIGYLIGLPLLLNSGIAIAIQQVFRNRYVGLILATAFVLLTTTSIGTALHIKHPLLRIGTAFSGEHSDMNGFGSFVNPFHWRMLYGICVALIIMILATQFLQMRRKIRKSIVWGSLIILLAGAISTGLYIKNHIDLADDNTVLNWQANYEKKYRQFQDMSQPAIKAVKTAIDLYPEHNSYEVTATYTLHNNTTQPISRLLFYVNTDISLKTLTIANQQVNTDDKEYGHYWVKLSRPLQPNDSINAYFEFSYSQNTFRKPTSFNSIVENGAFMRISNYFPRLGYQSDNEITEITERKNRNLGISTPLKKLETPGEATAEWLTIDMQLSTVANQTAIGVGELVKQWAKNNRNYFHYKTDAPVRFRFGVSSARYALKKIHHKGIKIEVYYHPSHAENVESLIANARNTLDYCETNFGKYPFKTARFAEISAFTKGFAATAYPATVFMTENMVFHADVQGANAKDLINELAGHELSHEWWGTNQFVPDNREGAAFLTEVLAMYTELMLIKQMYGQKQVLANVRMYRNMYLSERGFSDEQPLYKAEPGAVHLNYYKGLVSMYQLADLIGEEKVNTALRNLYQKFAGGSVLPVSTDFLNELYGLTDASVHPAVDDLFKQIIIYKPVAQSINTHKVDNQYETDFDVQVNKYEEDGKGKQTPVDFNGIIEVGFYWQGGREGVMRFPVTHNKAHIRVVHAQKPAGIILDPNEKLMKSEENTEYKLK